ncbi:MAG: 23S rRNA (adenine(2030)-N(6))-methyltransferase RlmJ [Methylovirgula sp.]
MNYRHAYHAGNFADVFKHVVLTRVLAYLALKETAFRVIDTHAGEGIYDLSSEAAEKTAEWRQGIGRLLNAGAAPADVAHLLEPYLAIVAPYVASESPRYPGSPALAAALLRKQDRMIFCEAHPDVANALKAHLGRDKRAKIIEIDGFIGLGAYVPPVERRGLVLIDPPFESRDEFAQILSRLDTALRKWPTGTYMVWFPIKDRAVVARFYRDLAAVVGASGAKDALRLELWTDAVDPEQPLAGNGLALINPPYVLEQEMRLLLPYLAQVLAVSPQAGYAISPL